MKALFVSNDPTIFTAGSPVRVRLATYAALIGELHVVSRAYGEAGLEVMQEGPLTLYPVHAGRFWRLFSIISAARRIIRERGIELVSAQDPFEHGLAAYLAARGTDAVLHIQIHTDILSPYFKNDSFKNRIRLVIAGFVLRRARGIRVVSERVKDSLVAEYGSAIREPVVIPVAIPQAVPPQAPLPPHSFMFALIAVGRLEREKCVEDVLAALALIRRKYPGVGLFIAGDGRKRSALEQRAHVLGLSEHVVFLGWRTDQWSLMQSAHAFVQASAYEGYGLTLLEAALARVPVVSTDVGIVGEVLAPEEDALVSPVGDVEALARNVERLIEKNELRETLTLHAYGKARAHADRYADQPSLVARNLAETLAASGRLQHP